VALFVVNPGTVLILLRALRQNRHPEIATLTYGVALFGVNPGPVPHDLSPPLLYGSFARL
jgi:hypothetical protein